MPPNGSTMARIASARLPGTGADGLVPRGILQNASRLGFHRSTVHGGALLEPLLQVVVDVADRDASHRLPRA
jgi:hypothetical protein